MKRLIAMFTGIPVWVQRLIAGIGAALALWGLIALGIHLIRADAVKDHETGIAAGVVKSKAAGDEAAAETDRINAVDNAIAAERADRAIAAAQASYPAEVKRQAGPAVRGVLEGLRK